MNATEIAPQTSQTRLDRIKTVSRIMRYVVLANLVFNVGFFLLFSKPSVAEFTLHGFLLFSAGLLMLFWFWKLAQLFGYYEQGMIFAAKTIRCIKILGIVCVCGWMMMVMIRVAPHAETMSYQPPEASQGGRAQVTTVVKHVYRMGFLSFDFGTGIDFGFLLVGGSVVLSAWIMDEGRKMREEQELTV